MSPLIYYIIFNIFFIQIYFVSAEEFCEQGSENIKKRYLLYDVNPGEGFNLRRDVYLRIASLIRNLNDIEPWVLVLPPWGNLYHWKHTERGHFHPWKDFFNVRSLQKWIPVLEFKEFIESKGHQTDGAFVLRNFEDMWERGWEERYEVASECTRDWDPHFWQSSNGKWHGVLWNEQMTIRNFSCLSFQGQASTLIPFLTKDLQNYGSVFLYHSEVLLHDEFGSVGYWSARRSMRFASPLVKEAELFRSKFLDSTDEKDQTIMTDDWRDFQPKHGDAHGGPYLATHLRRRDFLYARNKEIPSIEDAARQLRKLLHANKLQKLFVATDAPQKELDDLRSHLEEFELFFLDSVSLLPKYGDGGVAIIDQIICSHARYFIGTVESTFSFRIQEEREILGFSLETTFNRLCGTKKPCEQPTQWKIVYS